MTKKEDEEAKVMYDAAVEASEKQLKQTSRSGLVYIAEMRGSRLDHKVSDLSDLSESSLLWKDPSCDPT